MLPRSAEVQPRSYQVLLTAVTSAQAAASVKGHHSYETDCRGSVHCLQVSVAASVSLSMHDSGNDSVRQALIVILACSSTWLSSASYSLGTAGFQLGQLSRFAGSKPLLVWYVVFRFYYVRSLSRFGN